MDRSIDRSMVRSMDRQNADPGAASGSEEGSPAGWIRVPRRRRRRGCCAATAGARRRMVAMRRRAAWSRGLLGLVEEAIADKVRPAALIQTHPQLARSTVYWQFRRIKERKGNPRRTRPILSNPASLWSVECQALPARAASMGARANSRGASNTRGTQGRASWSSHRHTP